MGWPMMAMLFFRNITPLLGHVADQTIFVSTSPILPGPEVTGSIIDRTIIDVDERWVYVDIGQQTCQDGGSLRTSFSEQLAATRLQALHPFLGAFKRWDLDLSNHSDKSVGSFFVQDGNPRTGSSSEQLACIKQHAETSNDVLQFFHLQSIVTYLLVDAVLLMHQWGREMKKRSQIRCLIWLCCCFCVSDPVSLICHCRAVLSAQLGQKCRMCQQMQQHDCKHCILFWVLLSGETWIFQIILTNLLDLSLSRMGIRELAAPRSSLLVLNSMLRQAMTCCSFSICRV